MKCLAPLRIVLSILVVWTQWYNATGQSAKVTLPFTKYTVADGLAQMQVRSIFIDREGLIWIGTQGGISVFDGNSIRTPGNQGSLSENYTITLTRGKNNVYISTHTAQFLFDGKKVSELKIQNPEQNAFIEFEDQNQFSWYNVEGKGWLLKDNGEKFVLPESTYHRLKGISIKGAWGNHESPTIYLLDKQNKFYSFNNNTNELRIDSSSFQPSDYIKFTGTHNADLSNILLSRINKNDQSTIDIFKIVSGQLVHVVQRTKDNRLRAISDKAPLGFVERYKGANHVFMLMDSLYNPGVVPMYSGARYAVESFHKLYVATDEGFVVIHCDGIENFIYPECDYAWSVVPGPNNQLFLGCYKSGVHQLNKNGELMKQYVLPAFQNPVGIGDQILTNYLTTPDHYLWGSNGGFISLNNREKKLNLIPINSSIEALAYDGRSEIIIAGGKKLDLFNKSFSHIDSIELPQELLYGAFVNDLLITQQRNLFVAAPGGVAEINLENHSIESSWTGKMFPCQGAVALGADDKGNVWAGGTCGLLALYKDSSEFVRVLPAIIKSRVNQIEIIPGNRLVCASNNNLYVIDISTEKAAIIKMYDHKNGLNLFEPSENGSSITADGFVWLPSVNGIQRLNLSRIPAEKTKAKLIVIRLNGEPVRSFIDAPDTLRIKGHAALLELSLIDHTARGWQYQISINNSPFSPWQGSKEFLVSGLKHGINKVIFRASWNTSDSGTNIDQDVYIKTDLPFLNRKNVQLTLLGITIVSFIIIIMAIIRNKKMHEREQTLRSDLYRNRLKTIQAYLNPHFLFNTLTSIQDRILQHDSKTGNDLILRLARVFRKVLDTGKTDESKIPLIHLSEELDLITDMVYLNNAQMDIPVEMNILVEERIKDIDPLIPPLLIQPFVENAFKHAFIGNEKDKQVIVRIEAADYYLIIQIKDNGKGYATFKDFVVNNSMGSFLANERMNILNQLDIENSISIKDVKPRGTLVEIKIHFQNESDHSRR